MKSHFPKESEVGKLRVDYLIFGCRKFFISNDDRVSAVNALLKRNLTCEMNSEGEFFVSLFKIKKYKSALQKINYTLSDVQGVPSFFLGYRKRYGLIVGFLITIIYIIASSLCVWDVRIDGNEWVTDEEIEEELENVGFAIGNFWHKKSLSEIEGQVLLNSEKIGWINVNRRGTVAYVTVREKNVHKTENEEKGYSNIVATTDCVIEEITVKRGIACVKAGDTVKEGQLLISGVIPESLGGGFVRAEGEIFGIISEKVELSVPRTEIKNEYSTGELYEVSLNFFKFSIKLFKKYRKIDDGCVIIDDEKVGVLFGKYRIPFSLHKKFVTKRTVKTVTYTEKQLINAALDRQSRMIRLRLFDCDILKMQTTGSFTDVGYTVITHVTVLRNIGEEREFSHREK